jgi:hypothetical protein
LETLIVMWISVFKVCKKCECVGIKETNVFTCLGTPYFKFLSSFCLKIKFSSVTYCRSRYSSLFLSLSLLHTHTHTHTQSLCKRKLWYVVFFTSKEVKEKSIFVWAFTYSLPVALFLCHAPRALLQSLSAWSRKTPITFVIFVRPSVRMHHRGSHWMDFREIAYSEL